MEGPEADDEQDRYYLQRASAQKLSEAIAREIDKLCKRLSVRLDPLGAPVRVTFVQRPDAGSFIEVHAKAPSNNG